MSRVTDFDSFYESTSKQTLRALYAMTGDRAVARDSTIDAYSHAWRDWSKIQHRAPHRYVRIEAWKAQAVSRVEHPLRRRHEKSDTDAALLAALGDLPADDRRLLVTMTLGATDLDDAAEEVGVSDEEAIERVTTAIGSLETATGQSIDELEKRLTALGSVTTELPMPTAAQIRARATRGHRRSTIAIVAATVAAICVGTVALTDGHALDRLPSDSYRERLGAESEDLVLDAQQITTENLLTTAQVSELDPAGDWEVVETNEDISATGPLAMCAPERFATDDPLKVFVRTFVSQEGPEQRVAQSLEVASSVDAAGAAYARAVEWFGNCDVSRIQLTDSYRISRPYGDVLLLRLVTHGSAQRTVTVALNWSGSIMTTVVHETEGDDAPPIEEFARTINTSFEKICADSGGDCGSDVTIVPADPPAVPDDPGFLAAIDLPELDGVDVPWSSTEPTSGTTTNPAATACDQSDPTAAGGRADSRIYLLPEAEQLEATFGIVETVSTFASAEAATAYVDQVQGAIAECPELSQVATSEQTSSFGGNSADFRGTTWSLTLQVENGDPVTVRSAIVQRGSAVAQLLFTPSGSVDLSDEVLSYLTQRAGQRLAYAGS